MRRQRRRRRHSRCQSRLECHRIVVSHTTVCVCVTQTKPLIIMRCASALVMPGPFNLFVVDTISTIDVYEWICECDVTVTRRPLNDSQLNWQEAKSQQSAAVVSPPYSVHQSLSRHARSCCRSNIWPDTRDLCVAGRLASQP